MLPLSLSIPAWEYEFIFNPSYFVDTIIYQGTLSIYRVKVPAKLILQLIIKFFKFRPKLSAWSQKKETSKHYSTEAFANSTYPGL